MIFAPFVLGIAVVGVLFRYLLDSQFGLINYLLGLVGIPAIGWTQTQPWAWVGLVGMTVWWTLGFNTVIYLAGLQAIPREQYEAASLDGAGRRGQLLYVTVPGLRNILIFIVTTTVLASANMFGQSYLVTNGGPGDSTRTAIMVMTQEGLRSFKMGSDSHELCAGCVLDHHLDRQLPGHAGEGEEEVTLTEPSNAELASRSSGREPARRRRAYRQDRNGPFFWVGIVALALIFAIPLLWMFITSFRTVEDSRRIPMTLIPDEWTLRAYKLLFADEQNPVFTWALNSLIAATAHALLVLVVASMAAYALARLQFRGKNVLFGVIIATLFVPGFIFLMPNYLMMDRLGWLDTLIALIVPGAAGAFGVFFLRQFFLAIPKELEESALIDGANTWQIFTRIVLPNAKPALVTLGVLAFLGNWNDFIWPIFVLFSPERLTLPAGLSTLQAAYNIDYPVVMAGATVAALPVLILFVFVQRYVIEGVASSGLKG